MMSKHAFLLVVLFGISCTFADYTYVIEDGYSGSLELNDNESLLMTGGELYHVTLNDYCTALIENTDPLIEEHNGGIWLIRFGSYNHLEVTGGEIHRIAIDTEGQALLSGGRIDQIWSQQHVGFGPHITFDCKDWEHDSLTNILTGTWFDNTVFDIQLIDVAGYDPAIENIQFIPEPMSLVLLGIGGFLIRRKK